MPDATTGGPMTDQLTDLVRDRLGVDVPSSDTDLIAEGLIDSLALVTLIVGIEDTFGCRLPLDDFDIDRFRSVDAMAAFLVESGVTA
ncbi:acyl carrier protein [Actinomycetospora lutea]|uniref:acyl carrier protein n=1 Tax=Actinomycetospora lutea TaxID=663604 RepID=UPI002366748F|nr:acyl carrier protein [Actinomycetospora lutea]MDD7940095.1 acyl carrier protein [Actinomycetospora lutea]